MDNEWTDLLPLSLTAEDLYMRTWSALYWEACCACTRQKRVVWLSNWTVFHHLQVLSKMCTRTKEEVMSTGETSPIVT